MKTHWSNTAGILWENNRDSGNRTGKFSINSAKSFRRKNPNKVKLVSIYHLILHNDHQQAEHLMQGDESKIE